MYTRNDDDREKDIENLQSKMRKEIADAFTKQDVTKLFSSKFKDFVERGLMLILESVIGKCLWSRLYVIV